MTKPTPSNQNHSEREFPKGKEAYCPQCYFDDDKVILREECPHNLSISSEQRILERFEKAFPKETCQYYADGKIDGYCFDGVIVSQVKTFIIASLRTHTREVLEGLKEKVLKVSTEQYTDGTGSFLGVNTDRVIELLTEEIDKLK